MGNEQHGDDQQSPTSGDDRDVITDVKDRSILFEGLMPVLFGPYKLMGELGRGGMGIVYLASELLNPRTQDERYVAIKVIHPDVLNANMSSLFLAEGALLAQLSDGNIDGNQLGDDHIVHVYRIDRVQALADDNTLVETPCIVMQYVNGVTLRSMINQLQRKQSACSPALAAALIRQACLGLHRLHDLRDRRTGSLRRLVHRDVSPENLMCTRNGIVKLIDFGIVDAKDSAKLARESGRFSTALKPSYLSPEVFEADGVTHRSDLFSLGSVMHELLTGKMLFDSHDLDTQYINLRSFDYTPPPNVPPQLGKILQRTLAKTPEKRPATAAALAHELLEFIVKTEPTLLDSGNCGVSLSAMGVDIRGSRPLPLDPGSVPKYSMPVEEEKPLHVISVAHNAGKFSTILGPTRFTVQTIVINKQTSKNIVIDVARHLPQLHIRISPDLIAEVSLNSTDTQTRLYLDINDRATSKEMLYVPLGNSGRFHVGNRRTKEEAREVAFFSRSFVDPPAPHRVPINDLDVAVLFSARARGAFVLLSSRLPVSRFSRGGIHPSGAPLVAGRGPVTDAQLWTIELN